MAKIFQAGFSFGPIAQALRTEGIRQVTGAMSAAQAAANRIRFADEAYSDRTLNTASGSPSAMDVMNINLNINRATLDADTIIDDLNRAFRSRGLNTIGTRGVAI